MKFKLMAKNNLRKLEKVAQDDRFGDIDNHFKLLSK